MEDLVVRQLAPNDSNEYAIFHVFLENWRQLAPKVGGCAQPPNWRHSGAILGRSAAALQHRQLAVFYCQKNMDLAPISKISANRPFWRCFFGANGHFWRFELAPIIEGPWELAVFSGLSVNFKN